MQTGEFQMITDLAAVAPKELLFNYEEVKAWLTENLEVYRTLVVTQDSISEAKATRARINKVAKAINDQKVAVKKAVLKAYDEDFEPKCKELIALCGQAADNIDGQVKDFERRDAEAKVNALRAVYDAGDEEAKEYCPWERIYSPKWGNKSFPMADAEATITAALKRTADDLATIREVGGEDVAVILAEYKQTWDVGAAIRKGQTMKQLREAEAERARAAERAQAQPQVYSAGNPDAFEKMKPGDVVQFGGPGCVTAQDAAAPAEDDSGPVQGPKQSEFAVSFRVHGSREQLMALAQFMKDKHIQYEKI